MARAAVATAFGGPEVLSVIDVPLPEPAAGVGLLAVQLAVARGAEVIAAVTYGAGLVDRVCAVAPNGEDAALDLVGTDEAVDTSIDLVGDYERRVSIVAFGRGGPDGMQLIGSGPGPDPGTELRMAARPEPAELAASGQLRVTVAETYPLAEVAAAHRDGMTGHTSGKLILVP